MYRIIVIGLLMCWGKTNIGLGIIVNALFDARFCDRI